MIRSVITSNHWRCFGINGFLKKGCCECFQMKFAVKTLEKCLWINSFFNSSCRLETWNFTKNELLQRYFSKILTINLRISIFQNLFQWLLLHNTSIIFGVFILINMTCINFQQFHSFCILRASQTLISLLSDVLLYIFRKNCSIFPNLVGIMITSSWIYINFH